MKTHRLNFLEIDILVLCFLLTFYISLELYLFNEQTFLRIVFDA